MKLLLSVFALAVFAVAVILSVAAVSEYRQLWDEDVVDFEDDDHEDHEDQEQS